MDVLEVTIQGVVFEYRACTAGQEQLLNHLRGCVDGSCGIVSESDSALLPLAHLLERVARWTGRRPPLPVDILKTTAAGSLVFDGSRALSELGMTYTPLREALREAVEEIRDTP